MFHYVKNIFVMILAFNCLNVLAEGNLSGEVSSDDRSLPGVTIKIERTDGGRSFVRTTATNTQGRFRINGIPAGAYRVTATLQGYATHIEEAVEIRDSGSAALNIVLVSGGNVMESMTVTSASRRLERVVEAPAAINVMTENEIRVKATSGQIPRLLETLPGVEITQSGTYDFNCNARGFNSSLNRRILVLIDGRDPSIGFLGAQEWSSASIPMEDYSRMELVRGPGSALYGANAFNGVLNITTKRPGESPGGTASLTVGELSSWRGDLRYARNMGSGWSFRINGGGYETESWETSRTAADLPFEYDGLPIERFPYDREFQGPDGSNLFFENKVDSTYFALRVDKEFNNGHLLTLEGGTYSGGGSTVVTGIGRVYINDVDRPWFRVNYNTPHFNAMAWRTTRDTGEVQTSLASGGGFYEDSTQDHLEVQYNDSYINGKVDFVVGASYHEEEIDTANPQGIQTLMPVARSEDETGLFAQATFHFSDSFDLVLAARHDDASLHDSQTSPKAALVWKVNPNHTLRLTYNEAFQTPNYSEFFLRAPSTLVPFDVIEATAEAILSDALGVPFDLPLNWQTVPAVALGNDQLVVEENETIEVGYKGIIGSRFFLTLDYYQSNMTNFVTDLLPGVNPAFEFFQFPEIPGVTPQVWAVYDAVLQGALGPLYAGLINSDSRNPFAPTGHPAVLVSYTNAGDVDLDGIEFSLNYYLNDHWTLNGAFAYFDFDVNDQLAGDRLVPNASDLKYNLGLAYTGDSVAGTLSWRHVDSFHWAAGTFFTQPDQPVPTYDIFDLAMEYQVTKNFRLSLDVHNIADDDHYESFGGTRLGRKGQVAAHLNF